MTGILTVWGDLFPRLVQRSQGVWTGLPTHPFVLLPYSFCNTQFQFPVQITRVAIRFASPPNLTSPLDQLDLLHLSSLLVLDCLMKTDDRALCGRGPGGSGLRYRTWASAQYLKGTESANVHTRTHAHTQHTHADSHGKQKESDTER